jgi:hypothetical protein
MILIQVHLDIQWKFSVSEQYRVGFSPKYKYKGGEIVMNSASSIERDLFNFGSFRITNQEI